MKHRFTLLVVLTIIGLLLTPFAASADPVPVPPPAAEPPTGSEPPAPPPPVDGGANVYCPLPGIVYEGECTIFLDGDLSASEVATILTIAYAIDPLLGTAPIELPVILRYLKVHTPNIPGIGPLTSIQVGATCSAFVAAERLGDAAYYTCYAILSRAAGNATEHLCPALDKLIDMWLGRAGTAASKQMLETALMAKNAFCFGKSVSVGLKVFAMPSPAEPPPGAEPLPEPTPEPAAEYPDYCPTVAFTHEDGECVFVLEGEFTTSEVVALYRTAHDANPFLGASDIDTIMQYLQTRTTTTFGYFAETRVLIGKTCRDVAAAERIGHIARAGHYSNCVDALARISAEFKQLGCPALDVVALALSAALVALIALRPARPGRSVAQSDGPYFPPDPVAVPNTPFPPTPTPENMILIPSCLSDAMQNPPPPQAVWGTVAGRRITLHWSTSGGVPGGYFEASFTQLAHDETQTTVIRKAGSPLTFDAPRAGFWFVRLVAMHRCHIDGRFVFIPSEPGRDINGEFPFFMVRD